MLFLSAFPAAITSMLAGDAAGDAVQFPQRRELDLATSDRVSIRLQSAVIRANDSTRGGGGDTPLYGLYWVEPLDRVWFLASSALNRVYNFMRTCPKQGLNLS